tara:strand:- start:142 stop:471 length:330 start_codon:yes stop_codon:yes gene_type:complete
MVTAVTVVSTVAARMIKVALDHVVDLVIIASKELVIPDFAVTISEEAIPESGELPVHVATVVVPKTQPDRVGKNMFLRLDVMENVVMQSVVNYHTAVCHNSWKTKMEIF